MRDGQVSRTALWVCSARATIARNPTIRGFEEPFAARLLPKAYSSLVGRTIQRVSRAGAHIIALRMVAIDHAIRTAPALEQVVILGAGLDARAWRLPELADVPVYEVDHPDTQAYKQRKAADFGALRQHKYVAVDFTRDSLDERLEAAGHRADVPTIWIWEGVTMYLEPPAVEHTLAVVANRSATKSRMITSYLPPGLRRNLVGFATSIVGESFRATYTATAMRELLAAHGFEVTCDESGTDWNTRWALPNAPFSGAFADTERLVTADR